MQDVPPPPHTVLGNQGQMPWWLGPRSYVLLGRDHEEEEEAEHAVPTFSEVPGVFKDSGPAVASKTL